MTKPIYAELFELYKMQKENAAAQSQRLAVAAAQLLAHTEDIMGYPKSPSPQTGDAVLPWVRLYEVSAAAGEPTPLEANKSYLSVFQADGSLLFGLGVALTESLESASRNYYLAGYRLVHECDSPSLTLIEQWVGGQRFSVTEDIQSFTPAVHSLIERLKAELSQTMCIIPEMSLSGHGGIGFLAKIQ